MQPGNCLLSAAQKSQIWSILVVSSLLNLYEEADYRRHTAVCSFIRLIIDLATNYSV
jgi:hypothetical protein